MNKDELYKKIEKILDCPVNENTGKDNCESWDSLNTIKIMMMLQTDYGLKLSAKDIESAVSIKNIEAMLG